MAIASRVLGMPGAGCRRKSRAAANWCTGPTIGVFVSPNQLLKLENGCQRWKPKGQWLTDQRKLSSLSLPAVKRLEAKVKVVFKKGVYSF
jgi:hypothetical protein